jgi:IMP cyclohydrolase
MLALEEALRDRPYAGRGCVAARLADGSLWFAYFLTGRSDASRSRALEQHPDGDLRVVDTRSGGGHDALRHYVAAARRGRWSVVGNGDQVEPIADALAASAEPATAWAEHTFEPDPPIFTPRIWICADADERVLVGSARRSTRPDGSADRALWMPDTLAPRSGVLITTYAGTAEHVLTSGLPLDVEVRAATGEELLDATWDALGPALRVAAFAARPADLAATMRHR